MVKHENTVPVSKTIFKGPRKYRTTFADRKVIALEVELVVPKMWHAWLVDVVAHSETIARIA